MTRQSKITYRGIVRGGVVEFMDGPKLPDGTRVQVQLMPHDAGDADISDATGWPPGYFEETYGAITDDTFIRPDQGDA
ncbi:MAG: hypothetical protein KY475_11925 [Planctomycetes bacterium]|nr:hypothetical protein [Planctomycetota bacterium]